MRKEVRHLADQPLYLLGVTARRPWYRTEPTKQGMRLHHLLAENVDLPGESLVVSLDNERNDWLKKVMKKIPGSRIYPPPSR